MKKKLLALLLCLTMLLVMLPTVAMADEGETEPAVNNVYASLGFRKAVILNGTTTLPNETFEFKLEDKAANPQPLTNYGIQVNSIQVQTSQLAPDSVNANVFFVDHYERIQIDLNKVMGDNGAWEVSNGTDNNKVYRKSVYFSEVPGNSAGWNYDSTKYTLTFKYTYNPDNQSGEMTCEASYENESSQGILFNNTYTANSSTIIIVPETTEAAPNPTTGAAPANLGLGCVVIGLAAMGVVAYARKK